MQNYCHVTPKCMVPTLVSSMTKAKECRHRRAATPTSDHVRPHVQGSKRVPRNVGRMELMNVTTPQSWCLDQAVGTLFTHYLIISRAQLVTSAVGAHGLVY
jgi:hypothetical protein